VIFKLPTQDEGRKTGLSVWVDATADIIPVEGEKVLFNARARAYASWHVDPETHLPDGRQKRKSTLLKGECSILCTDERLAVLLTAGEIPGGTIRSEDGTALLAVFPLDKIDRVIAMNVAENVAEDIPRHILIFDGDDFVWGELRISSIHEQQALDGGRPVPEEAADLASMAGILAEQIAHARGLPLPIGKVSGTGDHIYRIK
jgi:hypothetical protein